MSNPKVIIMYIEEVSNTYNALKKSSLNRLQIRYLRLRSHDYSEDEIGTFLELSPRKLLRIKVSIMNKFGTDDWRRILFLCFKLEILNQKDFIREPVKQLALEFTNKIFLKNITSSPSPFFPKNTIRKLILEFQRSCQEALLNEAAPEAPLSSELKSFLKLQHGLVSKEAILTQMKLSESRYNDLTEDLLGHFSVNSVFNALRKGFECGYIEDGSNYIVGKQAEILNRAIDSICTLRSLNLNSNKMHKLHIYESLLEYYAAYENFILFKEFCNSTEFDHVATGGFNPQSFGFLISV